MFTGIVSAVGTITASNPSPAGLRLRIEAGRDYLDDVAVGDSIAVNGVCLTAVSKHGAEVEADVSHETLDCTAGFRARARVNLEKALRLTDRLGGLDLKVTRLAHGVPVGGELDYLDEGTLSQALKARTDM